MRVIIINDCGGDWRKKGKKRESDFNRISKPFLICNLTSQRGRSLTIRLWCYQSEIHFVIIITSNQALSLIRESHKKIQKSPQQKLPAWLWNCFRRIFELVFLSHLQYTLGWALHYCLYHRYQSIHSMWHRWHDCTTFEWSNLSQRKLSESFLRSSFFFCCAFFVFSIYTPSSSGCNKHSSAYCITLSRLLSAGHDKDYKVMSFVRFGNRLNELFMKLLLSKTAWREKIMKFANITLNLSSVIRFIGG